MLKQSILLSILCVLGVYCNGTTASYDLCR